MSTETPPAAAQPAQAHLSDVEDLTLPEDLAAEVEDLKQAARASWSLARRAFAPLPQCVLPEDVAALAEKRIRAAEALGQERGLLMGQVTALRSQRVITYEQFQEVVALLRNPPKS